MGRIALDVFHRRIRPYNRPDEPGIGTGEMVAMSRKKDADRFAESLEENPKLRVLRPAGNTVVAKINGAWSEADDAEFRAVAVDNGSESIAQENREYKVVF